MCDVCLLLFAKWTSLGMRDISVVTLASSGDHESRIWNRWFVPAAAAHVCACNVCRRLEEIKHRSISRITFDVCLDPFWAFCSMQHTYWGLIPFFQQEIFDHNSSMPFREFKDVSEQGLSMSSECIYCLNPSPFVFSPVSADLRFPFCGAWITLLHHDDHLLREITPNALLRCLTLVSVLPKHENSYQAHISHNYNKVCSSQTASPLSSCTPILPFLRLDVLSGYFLMF